MPGRTDAKPSERLAGLGIELPPVAKPLAAYVPALQVGAPSAVGSQVWTSGQLPLVDGQLGVTGKVGAGVTQEQAVAAARSAALNAIAAVAQVAGGIDRIQRIVKIVVFVASDPAFTAQAVVGNGASELIGEVFGEAGTHVRSAVGVAVLPLDAPVEVEMVAEVG